VHYFCIHNQYINTYKYTHHSPFFLTTHVLYSGGYMSTRVSVKHLSTKVKLRWCQWWWARKNAKSVVYAYMHAHACMQTRSCCTNVHEHACMHARTQTKHEHQTRNMKSVRAKSVVCMHEHACKHDIVHAQTCMIVHQSMHKCAPKHAQACTNVHQSVHDRA
jgi:hypothetical protein